MLNALLRTGHKNAIKSKFFSVLIQSDNSENNKTVCECVSSCWIESIYLYQNKVHLKINGFKRLSTF